MDLRFATPFIYTTDLTQNLEGEDKIVAETVMVIDNSDEEAKNDAMYNLLNINVPSRCQLFLFLHLSK